MRQYFSRTRAAAAVGALALVLTIGAPAAFADASNTTSQGSASDTCTPNSGTVAANSALHCELNVTNVDTVSHTYFINFTFYEEGTWVAGRNYQIVLKAGDVYNTSLDSTFGNGPTHGASFVASVGVNTTKIIKDRHAYTVSTG